MLQHNPDAPQFLDSIEIALRELRNTCDVVYRDFHSQETEVRHDRIFFPEDESKLWESGVLGYTTPISSQHAVFYCVVKC